MVKSRCCLVSIFINVVGEKGTANILNVKRVCDERFLKHIRYFVPVTRIILRVSAQVCVADEDYPFAFLASITNLVREKLRSFDLSAGR